MTYVAPSRLAPPHGSKFTYLPPLNDIRPAAKGPIYNPEEVTGIYYDALMNSHIRIFSWSY
jgi:hypothetical protein